MNLQDLKNSQEYILNIKDVNGAIACVERIKNTNSILYKVNKHTSVYYNYDGTYGIHVDLHGYKYKKDYNGDWVVVFPDNQPQKLDVVLDVASVIESHKTYLLDIQNQLRTTLAEQLRKHMLANEISKFGHVPYDYKCVLNTLKLAGIITSNQDTINSHNVFISVNKNNVDRVQELTHDKFSTKRDCMSGLYRKFVTLDKLIKLVEEYNSIED
ncbi:hypothetical protein HYO65_gp208 [Tenacibaculum phage PTm1]|uniref:Uncharacterized protein n=2 Tax=Shirahamavirus PTm1 TaxID=2846435 RepID=A0A5S9HXC6_9CAUD|nr:hypothetical protein HYO65_gp208 [Tenacibaculum phage PTm1]BBI90600.1 hypothetical protein [Tenacibaculum phage PTm1]BBI90907.1 hypothetical protein [Tenacibaculum phage PTm5]